MINRIQFSSLIILFFCSISLSAEGELEKFNKKSSAITFTENKGQVSDQNYKPRPDVLFSGEANGMVFHLREDGVSYQLYKRIPSKQLNNSTTQHIEGLDDDAFSRLDRDSIIIHRIDINWINPNKDVEIEYGEETEGYNNYYLAVCPEGISNVKSYKDITFKNVWDGIDIKWYERDGELEYDFILSLGADFNAIKWEINGADEIFINKSGQLVIKTPFGEIREYPPVGYQQSKEVEVSWYLSGNLVGFKINKYNSAIPLIIDPVVRIWGTYYGGLLDDLANSIIVDASDNVYIGGSVQSTTSIATTGSHQVTKGFSTDAFLVKFNSSGIRQWGTYYGGNSNDYGTSCATDGSSNVFLAGMTNSSSAIATIGSHQDSIWGTVDLFIVKFNSNGVRQWATYYGGSGGEYSSEPGRACAVDFLSNVYLTGWTSSTNNIATTASHQSTHGGSAFDAFLVKFDSSGVRQWATYYGDTAWDHGWSCATDDSLNVYMTGQTLSDTAISSFGSHQASYGGSGDAFLVKFDSSGVRQWATYYGGSSYDFGGDCVIDATLNVYLTGWSASSTAISTNGSHQSSYGGSGDAFLVKFNSFGIRQWATYYGGSSGDISRSCAVDTSSNIYITGSTTSSSAIGTLGSHQVTLGGLDDAFLVKFNNNGIRQWGTYYGGTSFDYGHACTIDKFSRIYICGKTSSGFSAIATSGSHQDTLGGWDDAFLVQLNGCTHDSVSISSSVCEKFTSPSGKYIWTSSGTYFDTLTNAQGCDSVITVILRVNNSSSTIVISACDTYVSPSAKYIFMSSGTYSDTVSNSTGCDSVITIILTINTVDSSASQSSDTLIANASLASYQWFDCSTGLPLSGDTNQIFVPTSNGTYAVEVTRNGCIDTSACYDISWVGINSNSQDNIHIYPNPTHDILHIDLGEFQSEVTLILRNDLGQVVLEKKLKGVKETSIDLTGLAKGIYSLSVQITGEISVKNVIKK